ncbi:MAG: hypothetical protein DMF06_11715 [Verrucomicrobia bacterium]|nr:MAG: hypothetical protein DMF06_11715 [Verrucomicrobiota bacterium]
MGTQLNINENLEEDPFDARLRDEAVYIDDAGFTAGVAQKLPNRPVRRWVRAAILIGVALLASVAVYVLFGGVWGIAEGVTRLSLLPLPVIWLGAAGATIVVMVAGLAAVVSKASGRSR